MEAVTAVAAAAVTTVEAIMAVATISAAGITAEAIFTAGQHISVRSVAIVHSRRTGRSLPRE
jgi:hypothetical protein